MTLDIRDARPSDEAEWRGLWAGYLAFYKVDLPPEVTANTWRRIMDPASPVGMRVADRDRTLEGFAIHLAHPSTRVLSERRRATSEGGLGAAPERSLAVISGPSMTRRPKRALPGLAAFR